MKIDFCKGKPVRGKSPESFRVFSKDHINTTFVPEIRGHGEPIYQGHDQLVFQLVFQLVKIQLVTVSLSDVSVSDEFS